MPEIPAQFEPWLRRLQYLYERFNSDRCRDTAAALTYMSLFAMVPLLTVLYTMASAVPAFQGVEANIQDLLFEHLAIRFLEKERLGMCVPTVFCCRVSSRLVRARRD